MMTSRSPPGEPLLEKIAGTWERDFLGQFITTIEYHADGSFERTHTYAGNTLPIPRTIEISGSFGIEDSILTEQDLDLTGVDTSNIDSTYGSITGFSQTYPNVARIDFSGDTLLFVFAEKLEPETSGQSNLWGSWQREYWAMHGLLDSGKVDIESGRELEVYTFVEGSDSVNYSSEPIDGQEIPGTVRQRRFIYEGNLLSFDPPSPVRDRFVRFEDGFMYCRSFENSSLQLWSFTTPAHTQKSAAPQSWHRFR